MEHSIDLQRYPEESNLTCGCRATIKCKLFSTFTDYVRVTGTAHQMNEPLYVKCLEGLSIRKIRPELWLHHTCENVLFKLLDLKFLLVLPQTADKLSRSGSPVNSCTTCTVLIYNMYSTHIQHVHFSCTVISNNMFT